MVAGGGFARPERSEAGAPRWIESEPRVDVGGDYLRAAGNDSRRTALAATAEVHRRAGLAAVTGEHYEGGHWLGSFAVYLTTRRGIPTSK